MKTIELGSICADCFNAINFNLRELGAEDMERARFSDHALSQLAEAEGAVSLHTGESDGFSWSPCGCCGSRLGGERWSLMGLKQPRKETFYA